MLLSSDQPLSDFSKDRLSHKLVWDELLATIHVVASPITVGVFGPWGCGKTTALRYVESKLEANPSFVPIWFDAWKYDGADNLLFPLVQQMIQQSGIEKSKDKKRKESARKGGIAVASFVGSMASAFVEEKIGVNIKESLADAKEAMKDHSELAYEHARSWTDRTARLEQEVHALAHAIQTDRAAETDCEANSIRIVIFVDDLDRCSPEHTLRLLEWMKLFFSVPGIVFVLAISPDSITNAVRSRYGPHPELEAMYLHKLVQLEFEIPVLPEHAHSLVSAALLDFNAAEGDQVDEIFQNLAHAFSAAGISNPRSIRRLVAKILTRQQRLTKFIHINPRFLVWNAAMRTAHPFVHKKLKEGLPLEALEVAWATDPNQAAKYQDRFGAATCEGIRASGITHGFMEQWRQAREGLNPNLVAQIHEADAFF